MTFMASLVREAQMRRFVTVIFTGALFLLADQREASPAPFELLADLHVSAGISGNTVCDQSLANAVVNPAVPLSCSAVGVFPGAFIQAFANPDGSIAIGGLLSAANFTSASVNGSVTMKGDLIHVQHGSLTTGWLRIVGRPSGAVTFSPFGCELGCSGAAFIEGDVEIDGIEHELVRTAFAGGLPGPLVVFPTITGAILVPFAVGVQMPIEYSFQVGVGLIGGIFPEGATLLAQFSLVDPPLIEILDDNLQLVADAQLVSAAGINYGAGNAVPVPEPAMLFLLGTGAAGLAARRGSRSPALRAKLRRKAASTAS